MQPLNLQCAFELENGRRGENNCRGVSVTLKQEQALKVSVLSNVEVEPGERVCKTHFQMYCARPKIKCALTGCDEKCTDGNGMRSLRNLDSKYDCTSLVPLINPDVVSALTKWDFICTKHVRSNGKSLLPKLQDTATAQKEAGVEEEHAAAAPGVEKPSPAAAAATEVELSHDERRALLDQLDGLKEKLDADDALVARNAVAPPGAAPPEPAVRLLSGIETGKWTVYYVPKCRKAFVKHTQSLIRKGIVKSVCRTLVTPPAATAEQSTEAVDELYASLLRSEPDRWKRLARENLGLRDPGDLKLTAAQTWEAIGVADCSEATIDKLGQYQYRAKDHNPYASAKKRMEVKLATSYETENGLFWHSLKKNAEVSSVSYSRVKDPEAAIADWTTGHHKRGQVLWQHGMSEQAEDEEENIYY
jgi:hypothetical protein